MKMVYQVNLIPAHGAQVVRMFKSNVRAFECAENHAKTTQWEKVSVNYHDADNSRDKGQLFKVKGF